MLYLQKNLYLCSPNQSIYFILKVKLLIIGLVVLFTLPVGAQTTQGKASYYANEFAGQTTASGETFSPDDLTCAHRDYPFGTYLLVKNLDNGREVVVRVNDRGPFIKGRIVDVSRAAAKELDMIRRGTCNVEVSVVSSPEGVVTSSCQSQLESLPTSSSPTL